MAFSDPISSSLSEMEGKLTNGQLPDTITKNLVVGQINQPRIEIVDNQMNIIRRDADSRLVPTTTLGGPTRDRFVLSDPNTGGEFAGFDEWGNGFVALNFDVGNRLSVNGRYLEEWVAESPYGIRGGMKVQQNLSSVGTANSLQWSTGAWCYGDRQYEFRLFTNIYTPTPVANGRLYLDVFKNDYGYRADTSSPRIGGYYDVIPGAAGVAGKSYLPITLTVPFSVPSSRHVDIAWAMKAPDGGNPYVYANSASPAFTGIYDMGPNRGEVWGSGIVYNQGNVGGTTPTPPPSPSPSPVSRTATMPATWSRTWQGGDIRHSNDKLYQGTYSGWANRSMIGFDTSPIIGGILSKLQLHVYSLHCYDSAGWAVAFSCHGTANPPSTFLSSTGNTIVSGIPKLPGWVTYNIPSAYWPYFQNGTYRGVSIGNGVGNELSSYGFLDGIASTVSGRKQPYLSASYTK